jgi:ABC-type lipoprotein release transport system permease subunit
MDAFIGLTPEPPEVTAIKQTLLADRISKMDNTEFFFYRSMQTGELMHYSDEENSVLAEVYFLPNGPVEFYKNNGLAFKYVEGISEKCVITGPQDIIIDQNFYELFAPETENALTVILPLPGKDGTTALKEFVVKGVVSNQTHQGPMVFDSSDTAHYVSVYLSQDLLDELSPDFLEKRLFIKTDYPTEVIQLCKSLNLSKFASYELHEAAKKEIRNQVYLKGITAIILFVLLGINLYSSFNNALKERLFEIGVKRAIGAGKKDIIVQFFSEGMIVMIANIVISAFVVMNLAVGYKFVQKAFSHNQWTIYLSPHSMLLFSLSVLLLSLSFSLIFAFQSTQVEIVKHLKSE